MARRRKQLYFRDNDLWYLVGVIATDGNLSSDGRHVDITSEHRYFLGRILKMLGLNNTIGIKRNGKNTGISHRIQISNKNFYEFLLSIGLIPNKSLSLGRLKIPEEGFSDFFRGVIDGDGSIRSWIHPSNGNEQWSLRVYSASSAFIHWLKQEAEKHYLVTGKIYCDPKGVFVLKYGKMAARTIFKICYYKGSPGLDRKAELAERCSNTNTGWSKSKTLLCSA